MYNKYIARKDDVDHDGIKFKQRKKIRSLANTVAHLNTLSM